MSKTVEYIKRLQRRHDHLKKRIDGSPNKDLSFDRAEKSALDFAIRRLKKDVEDGSDLKRDEAVASLGADEAINARAHRCNGFGCENCAHFCPEDRN